MQTHDLFPSKKNNVLDTSNEPDEDSVKTIKKEEPKENAMLIDEADDDLSDDAQHADDSTNQDKMEVDIKEEKEVVENSEKNALQSDALADKNEPNEIPLLKDKKKNEAGGAEALNNENENEPEPEELHLNQLDNDYTDPETKPDTHDSALEDDQLTEEIDSSDIDLSDSDEGMMVDPKEKEAATNNQ